jgi:hypothetical protein
MSLNAPRFSAVHDRLVKIHRTRRIDINLIRLLVSLFFPFLPLSAVTRAVTVESRSRLPREAFQIC